MTEGHQRDENRIRRSYLTELAQGKQKSSTAYTCNSKN